MECMGSNLNELVGTSQALNLLYCLSSPRKKLLKKLKTNADQVIAYAYEKKTEFGDISP